MQETIERAASTGSATEPFNLGHWLYRLQELNPWVPDFARLDESSSQFMAARKAACIERLKAGRDTWNRWAQKTLDLRREAEEANVFGVGLLNSSGEPWLELCRLWQALAEIDLRQLDFSGQIDVDFLGLIWPHTVRFSNSQFRKRSGIEFDNCCFSGDVYFDDIAVHSRVSFDHTNFKSLVIFDGAVFHSPASFEGTHFCGVSRFEGTQFKKEASFDWSIFARDANFELTDFSDNTTFRAVIFRGTCWFQYAKFDGEADFSDLEFEHNDERQQFITRFLEDADFSFVKFAGLTTFSHARFDGMPDFRSVQSKTAFSLADVTFRKIPDFTEASFHEPPRMDNVTIKTPLPFPVHQGAGDPRPSCCMQFFHDFAVAEDRDVHARFRKLRKMASDAKDHENELRFNGFEIASRRFWVDKPFGPGAGRFWWGWLYGVFSNYGQSIRRPLVLWALLLGMAWVCLPIFGGTSIVATHCHARYEEAKEENEVTPLPETSVAFEALMLSLRNALVFDKSDTPLRTYGCLYGVDVNEGGDKIEPVIPNGVTLFSLAQRFFSAIFLFLAGLALRNTYRLK